MQKSAFFLSASFFLIWAHAVTAGDLLSWEDCVLEARENHPDLISAREKINQFKADKDITQSAFFPQLDGNIDARTSESTDTFISYDVSIRQLILDGLKTRYDVERALKNIEFSLYDYQVASSNVRLRLRIAFIGLLKAQELIRITENIAHRRLQSKNLIALRYQAGREHRGSLLTSEANLAQAEFEVDQAGRNQALARRRLSKELGREKLVSIQVEGDFNVPDKDMQKPDFESLSQITPFLQVLIVQKEAARWGIKSAKAVRFPEVFASASLGQTVVEGSGEETWSLGAGLTVPFYEGGRLKAGIFKAESQFRQAMADERSGRDGVILTLEDAWTQFQDALGQVDVQRKFLEAARERAKIAQAQYSAGLISFDDWIIIEDNLVRVEKTFLDAEASALITEANWLQAQGETLDEN